MRKLTPDVCLFVVDLFINTVETAKFNLLIEDMRSYPAGGKCVDSYTVINYTKKNRFSKLYGAVYELFLVPQLGDSF